MRLSCRHTEAASGKAPSPARCARFLRLLHLGDAHVAQVDYFLKIDGVQGESQDAKHKGGSFQFGYQTQQATGALAGKVEKGWSQVLNKAI